MAALADHPQSAHLTQGTCTGHEPYERCVPILNGRSPSGRLGAFGPSLQAGFDGLWVLPPRSHTSLYSQGTDFIPSIHSATISQEIPRPAFKTAAYS